MLTVTQLAVSGLSYAHQLSSNWIMSAHLDPKDISWKPDKCHRGETIKASGLTLTDECKEVIVLHGSSGSRPLLPGLYHSGAPHSKERAHWLIPDDSVTSHSLHRHERRELVKIRGEPSLLLSHGCVLNEIGRLMWDTPTTLSPLHRGVI